MLSQLQKIRSRFSRRPPFHAALMTSPEAKSHWSDVVLGDVLKVPGMTIDNELKYFYWCCQNVHRPGRRVVELGPYVGRSTAAMVSGLRKSSDPAGKVVTIDLFQWADWMFGHIFDYTVAGLSPEQRARLTEGQLNPKAGDPYRPFFDLYMEPYQESLETIETDLQTFKWSGEPIDVLMIDAAKTPEMMDQIVREFFPCLTDGASLIHQDYKHIYTYWLHPVTERMIERGLLVKDDTIPGVATQGFRFRKRPGFKVEDYLQRAFTVEEMDRLLTRSVERFRGEKEHMAVVAARCCMLRTHGEGKRANTVAAEAITAGGYLDDYFLGDLLKAADGWARLGDLTRATDGCAQPIMTKVLESAQVRSADPTVGPRLEQAGLQSVSTRIAADGGETLVEIASLDTANVNSIVMQFQGDATAKRGQRLRISVFEPGAARPFYDKQLRLSPNSLQPVVVPIGGRPTIRMLWTARCERPSDYGQKMKCIAPIALLNC